MKINRFEELEVWQLSRTLVKEIYKVTNEGQFKKDFALRDQITIKPDKPYKPFNLGIWNSKTEVNPNLHRIVLPMPHRMSIFFYIYRIA